MVVVFFIVKIALDDFAAEDMNIFGRYSYVYIYIYLHISEFRIQSNSGKMFEYFKFQIKYSYHP